MILAVNLNNLSDVRYFAAMGADYLGFSLADLRVEEVSALVNWVEGPAVLLDLREETRNIAQWLTMAQAVLVNHYEPGKYPEKTVFSAFNPPFHPQGNYILSIHSPLKEIYAQGYHIFLDTAELTETLFQQAKPYIRGLVLSGGQEIKPGIKNYDRFEQIFSWLESS